MPAAPAPVIPAAAPGSSADADGECPQWARELQKQLDVLQQSTVLAQQEARAAREDSRRSDMILAELQRRVDGLRQPPAGGGLGGGLVGAATSGLAAGLVGSLWGGSKEAGEASGAAGYASGAAPAEGTPPALGALHSMMDAHFKQMEELCRRLGAKREAGPCGLAPAAARPYLGPLGRRRRLSRVAHWSERAAGGGRRPLGAEDASSV